MEEYTRKLASIKTITNLFPIEGKDKIELAEVDKGWQCIVEKGLHKIGEEVVFFEIDAVLPERPEFEFLRKRCWNEVYRGFRIKTLKFGPTISQGLIMPMSILPEGKYKVGQDLTNTLKIRHWDSESPLNFKSSESSGKIDNHPVIKFLLKYSLGRKIILPFIRKEKGIWPEFISKTDEERLASMAWVLEKYKDDDRFYVCEKLDGSSFSAFYRKQKVNLLKRYLFGICSRNIWLKTPDDSHFWKVARKYDLENVLKNHFKETGEELIIQGECIGPSIQKNPYGLKDYDLYIFNVINNRTKYQYNLEEMTNFCNKYGLKLCPLIDSKFKQLPTVNEMEIYSRGKSKLNPNTEREGVVIRLIVGGKKEVSYKQISSTFLLKNDQ